MTPNIADHNITTAEIAPGAVSISTVQVDNPAQTISPGQYVHIDHARIHGSDIITNSI